MEFIIKQTLNSVSLRLRYDSVMLSSGGSCRFVVVVSTVAVVSVASFPVFCCFRCGSFAAFVSSRSVSPCMGFSTCGTNYKIKRAAAKQTLCDGS